MSEPKLNGMTRKEIIRAWVRALESGEYKQGNDCLCVVNNKNKRSYCCLGVLCKVAGTPEVETVPGAEWGHRGRMAVFGYEDDKSPHYLSVTLSDFLNIDELGTCCATDYTSLANMNDAGRSFKRIAGAIRQGHVRGMEDAPELLEGM